MCFATSFIVTLRILNVVQNFFKHDVSAQIANHAYFPVTYMSKQKKILKILLTKVEL